MLSTYEEAKVFVDLPSPADRAEAPMMGFLVGTGLSMLLWAAIGAIVWALVG